MKKARLNPVVLAALLGLFVVRCSSASQSMPDSPDTDAGDGHPNHSSAFVPAIDSLVQTAMDSKRVVGTSVGVMRKGEVLVAKGSGFADLENDVKATEHSVYHIGSLIKQFTAAAIMLVVERGKINLDDDLTKFIPDYPTTGHRITIDRLLTHTSGIKSYTEIPKFWELRRLDLTHEQMITLFSEEPFDFVPGQRYQYNNSAYYLLGVIIEKVSGQSYAEFLRENLFDPLDLRETFYLGESTVIKNRVQGYEVQNGEVVNDAYVNMKLPFSGGSLGSTVMDLMKWQAALVRGQVVSQVSYRRMTTAATLDDATNTPFGYGLILGSMGGHRKIWHDGTIIGFRALFSYYPDDDLTVVVLCNTGAANPKVLESRIARVALGIPEVTVSEVPVSESDLQKYAGIYDPGREPLRLTIPNGSLMSSGTRLRTIGNHAFVSAEDPYLRFMFKVEGGEVMSLTIEREGQQIVAHKVMP